MSEAHDEAAADGQSDLKPIIRDEMTVFISHLHDDAALAQVLQDTLVDWGLNREQVWRSSDPASGVMPGNEIPDDIKQFLFDCNLVLYVYTSSEKNWEWCSWEIGLAEEPTHLTRIVTFQMLTDHAPKIRPASLRVGITPDEIEGFVRAFFDDENFFPGYEAFWPGREDNTLKRFAADLFEGIDEIRSKYNSGDEARWGSITLEVSGEDLAACEAEISATSSDAERRDALVGCLRLVATEGWGHLHFGYNDADRAVNERPTLQEMVDQWREPSDDDGLPLWANELVDEIWRSRRNKAPQLSWVPSRSAHKQAEYFYPVLTRLYKTNDGSRRYRIHTFAMDHPDHASYGVED